MPPPPRKKCFLFLFLFKEEIIWNGKGQMRKSKMREEILERQQHQHWIRIKRTTNKTTHSYKELPQPASRSWRPVMGPGEKYRRTHPYSCWISQEPLLNFWAMEGLQQDLIVFSQTLLGIGSSPQDSAVYYLLSIPVCASNFCAENMTKVPLLPAKQSLHAPLVCPHACWSPENNVSRQSRSTKESNTSKW